MSVTLTDEQESEIRLLLNEVRLGLVYNPSRFTRAVDRINELIALTRDPAPAADLCADLDEVASILQHEPGCLFGGVSGLACDCRLPRALLTLERVRERVGPLPEPSKNLGEFAPADLALLLAKVRALLDWGGRVVGHCERMNFNTREEEWIAEELAEIRRELPKVVDFGKAPSYTWPK